MTNTWSGSKTRACVVAAVFAAVLAGCGSRDEVFGTAGGAGGAAGPAGPGPALGLVESYGIATRAGLATTGALSPVINGDVAMVDTLTCNGAAVPGGAGSAGLGLCGANPPTVNGTVVIPPAADPVFVDLLAAFNDLTVANRPGGTPLGGSVIGNGAGACAGVALGCQGNATIPPGLYTAAPSIGIDGTLTLDAGGNPSAVFIFQMPSSTLTTGVSSQVVLAGGARASNVFWQVGSSATLGTNSVFNGNVLAFIDLTLNDGATSCGRTLSGANPTVGSGATTLGSGSTVSVPGNPSGPPTCL